MIICNIAEKLPESILDDTGTLTVNPDLSKAFLPVLSCKARYLIMVGSAGSGKSQTAARKIIMRCVQEQGHKFLILRKIGATIRNSVWALVLEILKKWQIPHVVNKSDFTIRLPRFDSQIIFSGLDDPEKIKSIQGVTGEWLEEATEFTAGDFAELDRRLRGDTPHYKQIIKTFNPDEATVGGVVLKADYFDSINPDAYIHHSTVYDNSHLNDPQYIRVLESEKDPVQRKIYLLGQWAAAKGLIFPGFKIVSELPKTDRKIYGIDFGFVDPSVILEIGIGPTFLTIAELMHQSESLTSGIVERLISSKVDKMAYIYCDSAEPDRIEEIARAGFRCVKPAKKDIHAGIDHVKKSIIYSLGDNTETNKDFSRYKWRVDRNGVLLDEPAHMFSHAPDALRYAAYTYAKDLGLMDGDNNRFDLR